MTSMRSGNPAGDVTLERPLPHNQEAERAVLGAILLNSSLCNQAVELLKVEDFFFESHRRIFEKMLVLSETGRAIDHITLKEELARAGELEQVGGMAFVASLLDGAVRISNIEEYAKIIKGKSVMRRLITASNQIIHSCLDQENEPDELLDNAEKMIFQIAEDRIRTGFVSIAEVARKQLELVEKMAERPQMMTGVPTGFTELDRLTNGFQPSDLIIIAARPSAGKTALGLTIAQNSAIAAQKVIGVFSLEMTKESLVSRMLCSEAHVDAHRLRGGFLNREEWARLAAGLQKLAEARIYIDDTPGVSILEMRAKARRLKAEHGLDMLIVDYLQLMRGRGRNESRQQEVSQISRDLKGLAKELNVPLIALSQLSRAPETRTDHKPQLSDLRESGCISGESLVTLAETGARVPIASLVGRSGFKVWALNEATMKLEAAVVSRAFATGRKPVYRLKTRLGREVRATANHKFRAFQGWRRLDELQVGDRLALPRIIPSSSNATMTEAEAALLSHLIGDGCTLPRHAIQYTTRELELAERVAELAKEVFGNRIAPRINPERKWYQVYLSAAYHLTHGKRNPVADWLTELGAFGYRSYEKFVPERVFEQPAHIIAVFLRHLWATDGCIKAPHNTTRYPQVYYATSSERLARDVQSLLLRLGINAVLRVSDQGNKGRPQFHVLIMGREDILAFADRVGAVSEARKQRLTECVEWVQARVANTNRDVIPREAWQVVAVPAMAAAGITQRQMQAALGNAYCGTSIFKNNIGRERIARLAEAVRSHELATLAVSDVYWDEIIAIEPDGEEEVFDLTVEKHHNFIAANLFAHNSIEQDADVVLFIYREEMYNPSEENAGIAEIIIGKQRNGPTDTVRLAFIKQFTRFENLWREG